MGSDIKSALRPTVVMLLLFALLLCGLYPLAVLGLGQAVFPAQATGSLIRDGDRIVGSSLIGQGFNATRYFWSRPSAAGKGSYASASSGSKLGPTSAARFARQASCCCCSPCCCAGSIRLRSSDWVRRFSRHRRMAA